AFAKLNSGFFDPEVSCAVFYHDQLVGSWGLSSLGVAGDPVLGRLVAIAAVVIELSVPVLLVVGEAEPEAAQTASGYGATVVSLVERFGISEAWSNTLACIEATIEAELRR
ncbi:MAG: hypothetical protein KY395_04375, partial [Actinobacteria bacterium]|nr:hypothetical protein [Actinomycetota bacterium]